MNIVSRTKEGQAWERQFKLATQRLFDMQAIIHNSKRNFKLETCGNCDNLKKVDKECPECEL